MKATNRTVLDLSKVQHGSFWYVNQYGQNAVLITEALPSVRMRIISAKMMALYHPDYIGETELQRAVRLNLLDIWQPVCSFQLTANHSITYTGKKAISMWKAWNERIFNKKR